MMLPKAKEYGIPAENIIIDPGIGFGKTCAHNLELLRKLKELRSLGYPILRHIPQRIHRTDAGTSGGRQS